MALAEAGGREPLVSPAQVGRSLAAAVLEEGGAEEGRWRREEVEESMEFPVHREVQLPGGLTYLYLASGVPTQVPPTHNTHHPTRPSSPPPTQTLASSGLPSTRGEGVAGSAEE